MVDHANVCEKLNEKPIYICLYALYQTCYKDCESPISYIPTTYKELSTLVLIMLLKPFFPNIMLFHSFLNLSISLSLLISINTLYFSNILPSPDLSSVSSLELNIFMVISFNFHECTCGHRRISIKPFCSYYHHHHHHGYTDNNMLSEHNNNISEYDRRLQNAVVNGFWPTFTLRPS